MSAWSTAADVATVASAIIGAGALFFVGWQVREARVAAQLQILQRFMTDVREHDQALAEANPGAVESAFAHYLNMLEVYAAAVNKTLARGVADEFIRAKIKDSIVEFELNLAVRPIFQRAITSGETFAHIRQFYNNHRNLIEDGVRVRRAA